MDLALRSYPEERQIVRSTRSTIAAAPTIMYILATDLTHRAFMSIATNSSAPTPRFSSIAESERGNACQKVCQKLRQNANQYALQSSGR